MFRSTAITLMLCLTSIVSQASPVTWYLKDVVFNDGGTASGSFVFDLALNPIERGYSGINIVSTAGSKLLGNTYTTNYYRSNASWVEFLQTSYYYNNIEFTFDGTLTDSGGSVPLQTYGSFESNCAHISCQRFHNHRFVVSGYVTSVVPIPPAVYLFGSALTLIGVMRRKISS